MKVSLRQFLFFIGLFAILVPIVAILSYFVLSKPRVEKQTNEFLSNNITQYSRNFLFNLRETFRILNRDIENSALSSFDKIDRRKKLKDHIANFLETSKLSNESVYWVVELVNEDTSIMRVSNSQIRVGSILEMTENMHLHRNFLNLLAKAKRVKSENDKINAVRVHNIDPNIYSVFTFMPEFNWIIGISFNMKSPEIVGDYLDIYTKYHLNNIIIFSIIISFIFSIVLFLLASFVSRDLIILQRVLEQLKRGNLTEAKYAFRMLSFDSENTFLQINIIEMDILQYINDLYTTLHNTKNINDKMGELSKHSFELLFSVEAFIKDQNLSVKQSALQSEAIVLSANSLNVTALNSSRELVEFLKTTESANESLVKLKASISKLSKAYTETSAMLEFISGLTVKIKEVVLDINKVSENANLVSFNIAIEAEKVGVEGLALSLLSREIHNVAIDTKKLSEKIEFSAMDLQDTLNVDLSDMAKFNLKMQDTNFSLSILAGNLGEIIKGVNNLLRGFESLSSIISEQFNEAHKLSSSMTNLSNTGEQLSLNISNFKADSDSLMQRTRELKAKVSEFHF